eukprot:m51a1_g1669 hypothetical protein (195) ;mRNA; f:388529-389304
MKPASPDGSSDATPRRLHDVTEVVPRQGFLATTPRALEVTPFCAFVGLLDVHKAFFEQHTRTGLLDCWVLGLAYWYLLRLHARSVQEDFTSWRLFEALCLAWDVEEDSDVGRKTLADYVAGPEPVDRDCDSLWRRKRVFLEHGKVAMWEALGWRANASFESVCEVLMTLPAHPLLATARSARALTTLEAAGILL